MRSCKRRQRPSGRRVLPTQYRLLSCLVVTWFLSRSCHVSTATAYPSERIAAFVGLHQRFRSLTGKEPGFRVALVPQQPKGHQYSASTTRLMLSIPGFGPRNKSRRQRRKTRKRMSEKEALSDEGTIEEGTSENDQEVANAPEDLYDSALGSEETEAEQTTLVSASASSSSYSDELSRRQRIRKRVTDLARRMVIRPISNAAPLPQAIASVLKDATLNAVDMAVEEVIITRNSVRRASEGGNNENRLPLSRSVDLTKYLDEELDMTDAQSIIDEAFLPLEQSLQEAEEALEKAREAMKEAKSQAMDAMGAVQAAAIAQAEGALSAVAAAEEKVIADIFDSATAPDSEGTSSTLTFDDVDYDTSEMAPPFIGEDQCLVPGEPVVRVEKAPENSRRIFAGIDIMASVDDVWNVLTNYSHLQDVVPNLVVNDVLDLYDGQPLGAPTSYSSNGGIPEEEQCQTIASRMKGALLRQVGGAKVAGINFSARTTLEVREWPQGMPDFAHFNDEIWEGKDRRQRAKEYSKVKLQRYCFPRPFAISSLPTRDISMQSIENDDGEFRMYQGVWRMQPLPGCAPPGQQAMRLTYAVEVSPRAYLPVQLIEGRIVRDLCTNLEAIRDFVT